MSVGDVLSRIVEKLDAAAIPHMIVGSFASTYHGVPRSTYDIDIVIDPGGVTLDAFLSSLPPDDYYVDPDVARDALRVRSQFNVIDMATGWKVDLIIRKDREFSREEFRRREAVEMFGTHVYASTAEDELGLATGWAHVRSG